MPTKPTPFDNKNHIIVKQAISKDVCELVADYVNLKASLKPNIKKKDALSGVHREYGDFVMETLMAKLHSRVEAETNMELWPTLSFCYLYKEGDQLARHKDRSSCQIVAGLCIGSDDDFKSKNKSWPLIIQENGNPNPIMLDCGDMVIFKGYETEHWREPFTGKWFVSAIFGFVDKNGPFGFQKYDQRKQLGMPHVGMFHWLFGCIKNSIKNRVC